MVIKEIEDYKVALQKQLEKTYIKLYMTRGAIQACNVLIDKSRGKEKNEPVR